MKCLWRQIQTQGLQRAYGDPADPEFRIHCNMFGALAFVPPDEVPASFDLIVNSLPVRHRNMLQGFIEYYEVSCC